MDKKIIIGADPLGFSVKEAVKAYLEQQGYEVTDIGTADGEHSVEYYRVGSEVGKRISFGEFERGIIFCGTGMGVNIVANKYPGVYCGLCESVMAAKLCRTINNCNVLSIGGLFNGGYKAVEMVKAFLETEFAEGFSEASPEFLRDSLEEVRKLERALGSDPGFSNSTALVTNCGNEEIKIWEERKMSEYHIPEKAKIAVLTGTKKIEVLELPVPKINEDEILVKVEQTGICGTDVHEYKGDPFGYIPIQLGHEGTGTIVKLGKNVTKDYYGRPLTLGDKVVTGLKPCGVCETCLHDPEYIHLCEGGEIFGLIPGEDAYRNFNGWFGEYIKINAGGVVFNVSDMDVDLRTLIEPMAVVVHAVEKGKEIFNFKHGSFVLVQGCGPIGLLLLTVVRTMGVRNIIAVDGDEKRLDMAKKLGAAWTINFQVEDAGKRVKEITGTGAEMAFQCTGSPRAASSIWKYVRRGGAMCELGFFVDNGETTYNPHQDIYNKEIKVTGSWTYQARDWMQACEVLKEAKKDGLPVEKLLTHKYRLEEINEAMEMNISMQGLKIVVRGE